MNLDADEFLDLDAEKFIMGESFYNADFDAYSFKTKKETRKSLFAINIFFIKFINCLLGLVKPI